MTQVTPEEVLAELKREQSVRRYVYPVKLAPKTIAHREAIFDHFISEYQEQVDRRAAERGEQQELF